MNAIAKKICLIFLFVLTNGFVGVSAQQDYPNRPVKVIVPYVAGGAADITARVISQKL